MISMRNIKNIKPQAPHVPMMPWVSANLWPLTPDLLSQRPASPVGIHCRIGHWTCKSQQKSSEIIWSRPTGNSSGFPP